jgi:hypothetical protein
MDFGTYFFVFFNIIIWQGQEDEDDIHLTPPPPASPQQLYPEGSDTAAASGNNANASVGSGRGSGTATDRRSGTSVGSGGVTVTGRGSGMATGRRGGGSTGLPITSHARGRDIYSSIRRETPRSSHQPPTATKRNKLMILVFNSSDFLVHSNFVLYKVVAGYC